MNKSASSRTSNKVFVATQIGNTKEYVLPYVQTVVENLNGGSILHYFIDAGAKVPDTFIESIKANPNTQISYGKKKVEDAPFRHAHLAHIRELQREAFLKTDCTHLYYHDADMVSPPESIETLLKFEKDDEISIIGHVYVMRGWNIPTLVMLDDNSEQGDLLRDTHAMPISHTLSSRSTMAVQGVGFGGILITRKVAEKVAFRPSSFWQENEGIIGEDYQYCRDYKEAFDKSPRAYFHGGLWHLAENGTGVRTHFDNPIMHARYAGGQGYVRNAFGVWYKGVWKVVNDVQADALQGGEFEFSKHNEIVTEQQETSKIWELYTSQLPSPKVSSIMPDTDDSEGRPTDTASS